MSFYKKCQNLTISNTSLFFTLNTQKYFTSKIRMKNKTICLEVKNRFLVKQPKMYPIKCLSIKNSKLSSQINTRGRNKNWKHHIFEAKMTNQVDQKSILGHNMLSILYQKHITNILPLKKRPMPRGQKSIFGRVFVKNLKLQIFESNQH